jgi:GWxTD domain-containing protein
MIVPITVGIAELASAMHSPLPIVRACNEASDGVIKIDVVSFKGKGPAANPMVDLYVAMPYEHLQFASHDGSFVGEYSMVIEIRDTSGRTVVDTVISRTIVESSYTVTRGKTGKSDNVQQRFMLAPNTYIIEIGITDEFGMRTFTAQRTCRVRDYASEHESLSSILYLSDIEQRGNRYMIVPYIGEYIWSNEQRLFAFFEFYSQSIGSRVGFTWDITTPDMRTLATGSSEIMSVTDRTMQSFVPLTLSTRLIPGDYILSIRAHSVSAEGVIDTTNTLALSQRPYRVPQSMAGDLLKDIRKAIKQLMYVAGQDTIDSMLAAKTDGERLTMFENFWKSIDPSPSTAKNEALEEYYARIQVANERFKSYNEGWLTDMGRVYIIYGEPITVEKMLGPNRLTVYSRWTYPNGVVVTFEDPSGFGDFRLRSPLPGNPKYEFRRSTR